MMFLENLNLQSLILMAGLIGDTNSLAAMVLIVSIGEFLMNIPYGLALSASAFIGNALGANRPNLARSNSKIFTIFAFSFALVVCSSVLILRHPIISIYGASSEVRQLSDFSIIVFCCAFLFDWMQCSVGGALKGVGK